MLTPRFFRPVFIATAIAFGIAGCSSLFEPTVTITDAKDFEILGRNSGMNGGSYIYASWYYRGSDAERDYFYHYYSEDNSWHRERVEVRRGVVSLACPGRFELDEKKPVPLEAVYEDGRIAEFSPSQAFLVQGALK